MRGTGQSSTEYVLLVAFILALILPVIYIVINAQAENHDAQDAQLTAFAESVISKAGDVYSMGSGARAVMNLQLPEGITYIETKLNSNGNYDLVVWSSELEYFFPCRIPLRTSLPSNELGKGLYNIDLEAKQDAGGLYVLASFYHIEG
jgi:hypothetical protein